MCDACNSTSEEDFTLSRRRNLWEIDHGWHCSIVGTCLTLGDLRMVAKKLGYKGPKTKQLDYFLHGHFVKEAGNESRASRLLNKILDRKHAATLRRWKAIDCPEALGKAWDEAFNAGDIPGPYWALLSHPKVTTKLGARVYGDVHMLSHLVGASNRVGLDKLKKLETELADLQEQFLRRSQRYREKLDKRDQETLRLKNENIRLSRLLEDFHAAQTAIDRVRTSNINVSTDLTARLIELEEREKEAVSHNKNLSATISEQEHRITALTEELSALETAVSDEQEAPGQSRRSMDLCGRCILYVGGRTRNVCRMRTLVEQWKGELVHHDGGLEQSTDTLARAINQADTVVFPTDCVSHSAMHKVKNLCERSLKPFVPLRSSGVGSFVAGLETAPTAESPN